MLLKNRPRFEFLTYTLPSASGAIMGSSSPTLKDDDYLYSRYAQKKRQNTRNKLKFSSACRSYSPQEMKRYRMIQGIPHYLDARSSSSTGLISPFSTRYSPRTQSPAPPYN